MRILIAGTGRLGAAILEPLLDSGHVIVGLILNGRRTRGALTRYFATSLIFGGADVLVRIARNRRIPIYWLDAMTPAALEPLARLRPDLLITCGFGIILKRPLLTLPAIGCINVHSSLLPRHRGPMPFSHVILAGDAGSGVTFHVTSENIDAGDILDQRPIDVTARDNAMSVHRRCCELAGRRIRPVVDAIAAEGLNGVPQDESHATYDPPLSREDMRIDWSRSAQEIDRLVRAGTPYLSAWFEWNGHPIDVARTAWDATPAGATPGTVITADPHLRVATGAGTLTTIRASATRPILWPWPNLWSHPRPGEKLG